MGTTEKFASREQLAGIFKSITGNLPHLASPHYPDNPTDVSDEFYSGPWPPPSKYTAVEFSGQVTEAALESIDPKIAEKLGSLGAGIAVTCGWYPASSRSRVTVETIITDQTLPEGKRWTIEPSNLEETIFSGRCARIVKAHSPRPPATLPNVDMDTHFYHKRGGVGITYPEAEALLTLGNGLRQLDWTDE